MSGKDSQYLLDYWMYLKACRSLDAIVADSGSPHHPIDNFSGVLYTDDPKTMSVAGTIQVAHYNDYKEHLISDTYHYQQSYQPRHHDVDVKTMHALNIDRHLYLGVLIRFMATLAPGSLFKIINLGGYKGKLCNLLTQFEESPMEAVLSDDPLTKAAAEVYIKYGNLFGLRSGEESDRLIFDVLGVCSYSFREQFRF
jgi:hypothetical protein